MYRAYRVATFDPGTGMWFAHKDIVCDGWNHVLAVLGHSGLFAGGALVRVATGSDVHYYREGEQVSAPSLLF